MVSDPMFKVGDVVYLMENMGIERVEVTRVSKTMAFIGGNGRERKFSQRDGRVTPRPQKAWSVSARLERPTPELNERFRVHHRRELARRLEYAAQQFNRRDDQQEQRIHELYGEWAALGKDDTNA